MKGRGHVKMLKDDVALVISASSGEVQMLPDRQGGLPRAFEILFAHCVQPENIIEGSLSGFRSLSLVPELVKISSASYF